MLYPLQTKTTLMLSMNNRLCLKQMKMNHRIHRKMGVTDPCQRILFAISFLACTASFPLTSAMEASSLNACQVTRSGQHRSKWQHWWPGRFRKSDMPSARPQQVQGKV